MISIIAAIGRNGELGKDNHLIFSYKEDMAYFRRKTMGHPVVMGANTLASIGGLLPNRLNYIVTRHPEKIPTGGVMVADFEKFLEAYKDSHEEIFIIGGASIYVQALPYASKLYLTEIDLSADADAFFPAFDHNLYARKVIKQMEETNGVFAVYTRKNSLQPPVV